MKDLFVKDRVKAALRASILSIPYAARVKGPTTKGWPDLRYETEAEIDEAFPEGCNVGFLLGAPSGDLVDVDLDCPEALALADVILPPTPMVWGRTSTPRAHRGYRCAIKSEQYKDPAPGADTKAMMVEIRSTGQQTMAPGSTHPNGEAVDYAVGATIAPAIVDPDLLHHAVADLAVAALLVRHYPAEGARHEAWAAFASVWLAAGEGVEDGEEFARLIAHTVGDDEPGDRANVFASTRARLDSGAPATGCTRLGELLGLEVALALRKWLGRPETAIEIRVSVDLRRTADQAEQALGARGEVYQRDRRLVRVGRDAPALKFLRTPRGSPLITALSHATLQEQLSSCATWIRQTGEGEAAKETRCKPPRDVVEALLARGEWSAIPCLTAISEIPLVLADGRILATDGYDAGTGIYLCLQGLDGLQIPEQPAHAEAVAAAAQIYEAFRDFPLQHECSFSAALAALLTPFGRFAFEGPVPLTLIDSNTRGAGKGLLADVISVITTGRHAARMGNTIDDDEMGKRLLALAIAGAPAVLIDNVEGRLGTSALDLALTAEALTGRILGVSQVITVPWRCQVTATGNNVQLHGDTCRRTLHVRLESDLDRPEERADFAHPDLLRWVGEHRKALITACLTVLRAHAIAGRPRSSAPPWGSYRDWQDTICAAVAWAGLEPAEESRAELQDDDETEGLRAFLSALRPLGELSVAALLAAAEARKNEGLAAGYLHPELRDAIQALAPGRGDLPDATRLGYVLRRHRGRVIAGMRLDSRKTSGRRVWLVREGETWA